MKVKKGIENVQEEHVSRNVEIILRIISMFTSGKDDGSRRNIGCRNVRVIFEIISTFTNEKEMCSGRTCC